jgi:hypothetical protein
VPSIIAALAENGDNKVIAKANGLKKFGIFDFISIPIYIINGRINKAIIVPLIQYLIKSKIYKITGATLSSKCKKTLHFYIECVKKLYNTCDTTVTLI